MFKRIYVEITNVCNLNCSFCIGNKREKKFISLEEFEILLNKLEGFTDYLYFHIMGEPLIHPYINELLEKANKKFKVNITTNGYFIKKIKNNDNIRQINISLHSFDLKYKKSLEQYMDDIFEVSDLLTHKGTIINYRLWVGCLYKEDILRILSKKYENNVMELRKVKLKDNVFLDVAEEFTWPSYDNDYCSKVGSCRGTRDHIGVLVDGTIVPCCLDSAGIIKLGNIYKQDLNDIIRSELFKKINEGFKNNLKVHSLCQKCNFYEIRR